jgi:dTDP-4-amino-4,6-dideoxygalactose transaminase
MIPLYKVRMPKTALKAVKETLYSGYIAEGKKTAEFENKFQDWIGNPYAAVVNSGTSALTLALYDCGVTTGTNVISTPLTCVATNTPIKNLGASIRWADINPKTGNMLPESIEALIDKQTRAIMVVHWGGYPADIKAIHKIAKKHKIPVIEDAAHALGALYYNKKIGNHSDYVCFSFQAIKHITTIEGGAVACKTKNAYDRIKRTRWFGLDRTKPRTSLTGYENMAQVGFKMNMNDVHAAIGLEQLKDIDWIILQHQENAAYLTKHLPYWVETVKQIKGAYPSYWFYSIMLPAKQRKVISDHLTKLGIENSVSHIRNDSYPALGKPAIYQNLNNFAQTMLNIPCGWWLSKKDLDKIISAFNFDIA